jgi:hypothetical protein
MNAKCWECHKSFDLKHHNIVGMKKYPKNKPQIGLPYACIYLCDDCLKEWRKNENNT